MSEKTSETSEREKQTLNFFECLVFIVIDFSRRRAVVSTATTRSETTTNDANHRKRFVSNRG